MKKQSSIATFILLLLLIWYLFHSQMPQPASDEKTPKTAFSAARALHHVKALSKGPHYLGGPYHKEAKDYLIRALKDLGLQPEIQEGFSMHHGNILGKPQNIIAKIKGSTPNKAVLLMAHYDSAAHSAMGASDDASGIATILEGVRAYLSTQKTPKNDIIICFTDGEELGHLGAELFVQQHPYAGDIGVALNFEARGSGGPSYMLMETNDKNENLITAFSAAKVPYPVANSLAYSIYKMLPNDTDLSPLKAHRHIEGFNFAFIDDYYDYHSANDTWQNLDMNTLQHQGSYLMSLLHYYTETLISTSASSKDYVYFTVPIFKLIHYPFSWIYGWLGLAVLLFCAVLWYGKATHKIQFRVIGKSIVVLVMILLIATLMTVGSWKILYYLYPEYPEIQQGFPYNGHYYIAAFVCVSLAVCFRITAIFQTQRNLPSFTAAALCLWMGIACLTAIALKGASFFVIPLLFGLIALWVMIRQRTPNAFLLVFLSIPAIFLLVPFIKSFPIALGFKIIAVVPVLTVLVFGLLLPVFGTYRRKKIVAHLALIGALVLMAIAHFKSDFTPEHPKPNSLLYVLDADENQATWATYDRNLDSWTNNYLSSSTIPAKHWSTYVLQSKYQSTFTHTSAAPLKAISQPKITISKDTLIGNRRHCTLMFSPQRNIHRMELYFEQISPQDTILANGFPFEIPIPTMKLRPKIPLTYYVRDKEPLVLEMNIHAAQVPKITLLESAVDLLEHPLFSIPKREPYMMTRPFVMNDAIVIKKTITPEYTAKVVDSLTDVTTE